MLLALASLPLVHPHHDALSVVCHLNCSLHLGGLGSLLLVGCLIGGIEFLLLAKNDVFPECPTPTLQRGGVPLLAFPLSANFGFQ